VRPEETEPLTHPTAAVAEEVYREMEERAQDNIALALSTTQTI
jgi:hypothetical protein